MRVSSRRLLRFKGRKARNLAALEAGQVVRLDHEAAASEREIEHSLKVGKLAPALRRYYR